MQDTANRDAALLQLQNICLTLNSSPFSLEVKSYEYLTVLGDDSSLLDALTDVIAGEGNVVAGQIMLSGVDVTRLGPRWRSVGVLDRRNPLFGHLDVRQNILFPLRVRRLRQSARAEKCARLLATLNLEQDARKKPATLPAEGRFRAKLARILAYAPEVILLNQPFEGLNEPERARCRRLVVTLQRALELTVLHLTLSREEALSGGARIAVMQGGRCLQCDTAQTLNDRPSSPHVARRMGDANILTGYVLQSEDGLADIRLPNGAVVPASAPENLAENSLCQISIRPEKIAVSLTEITTDETSGSTLEATVQHISHMGDYVLISCKLADGTEVDIKRMSVQYSSGISIGQRIFLAWSAGQARAYRDEEASSFEPTREDRREVR